MDFKKNELQVNGIVLYDKKILRQPATLVMFGHFLKKHYVTVQPNKIT